MRSRSERRKFYFHILLVIRRRFEQLAVEKHLLCVVGEGRDEKTLVAGRRGEFSPVFDVAVWDVSAVFECA